MLEPSIKQRLLDRYQQMSAEGKLLSRDQLDRFCQTFRDRFGPDRLARLDGEALLEAMHAHGNHDSLVYWLEFKNDEEFPAPRFGSIAGGSAFKFGLFRRKGTGTWVTADEGNAPRDLTVDEAVVIARRHRDQLLRGVEHLRRLPPIGTDDDYRRLQADLDRDAPDVSDLAWGHKYFSLLFSDQVDDIHLPEFQRFLLVKLLQPPPEGKGRYLCAGRYVAAAHELGVPLNPLVAVVWTHYGRRHRYWRVGTSDGTASRNRWALMRDGDCVAIGWGKLGDLSGLDATRDGRDRLQNLLAERHPANPSVTGRARNQVMNFLTAMAEGDVVLAADGGTVLGIGRVTGEYAFDGSSDFPHRRPVEWLSLDEWKLPQPEGLQTTVHQVKQTPNLLEVERRVQGAAARPGHQPPDIIKRPEGAARPQPPRLAGVPGLIQSVLERKGQCILYGPPGTGKTFWAERAALDLAAHRAFGRAFGDLNAGEKAAAVGDGRGGLVRLCTFHPSYGYEDFIEGYRPEAANGQIAFRLRDGLFKRLCADAARDPDRRYYLLVDEINRGDLPRIFGELLTVLEMNKRDKAVVLPLSGDALRVPRNVYLIGTMNTADRSICLLDAALRRRFGFVELMPDPAVFKDHAAGPVPLGPWLAALNERICENVGRDARNLQVGHSYLLDGDGRPLRDLGALKRALRDDIIPLLEEYCYDDFDALQKILGNGLVDAASRRIRAELFEGGQEDDLVQALLEPSPDVLASPEALSAGKKADEPPADDADSDGGDE
jgi:5-methylcytosine-specific restriction protein B